jgi:hypothetical protein
MFLIATWRYTLGESAGKMNPAKLKCTQADQKRSNKEIECPPGRPAESRQSRPHGTPRPRPSTARRLIQKNTTAAFLSQYSLRCVCLPEPVLATDISVFIKA